MRLPPRHSLTACVALAVAVAATFADRAAAQSIAVKRLFAPPADVASGVVALPSTRDAATASQAALLFAPRAAHARFALSAAPGAIRIAPLAPDAIEWSLALAEGDEPSQPFTLAGDAAEALRAPVRAFEAIAAQSAFGCDAPTRMISLETRGGSLAIDARIPDRARTDDAKAGEVTAGEITAGEVALLVDDDSAVALMGYPERWTCASGEILEIVVEAAEPVDGAAAPLADATLAQRCRAGVMRAHALRNASIRWADGHSESPRAVFAKAGRTHVRFANARAGNAVVRIDADVVDGAGAPRTRSVAIVAPVAESRSVLAGLPRIEPALDGAWMHLAIPVATMAETLFAASELWAIGDEDARCIGWIGGIAEVERGDRTQIVRVGCETARLQLAPGERLECRNLRLHARDGFAPLFSAARAGVDDSALARGAHSTPPVAADFGIPGVASIPMTTQRSLPPAVGAHALVLTHGYCADENPWPLAHFSGDAWPYLDANANRSHDSFALDIASDAAQFKSYGIVGHSQGGCAALHLYTFYWSGLDWTGPGRLIQAVGSPFEGTPIAGNLAALGEVFGVQCGSNYDLTTAGAAAWLSTIPTAARAKVYTHTTTFTNNPFVYDYCNIFVDPFLGDPEDGVVEHAAGHFPGANDMGLRSGWCHVSGMRDPAQTNDSQRNGVMNAEGAR